VSERIVISPPERKMLETRARARSGSVAEAMRSKIVLSLAAGNSQAQTSRTVGCSVNTVRLWKERFVGERLGGLYGRHRGRSRSKESRYSYLARFLFAHVWPDAAQICVDFTSFGWSGSNLLILCTGNSPAVRWLRDCSPGRQFLGWSRFRPRAGNFGDRVERSGRHGPY
jgi:Winged helix-turn helix